MNIYKIIIIYISKKPKKKNIYIYRYIDIFIFNIYLNDTIGCFFFFFFNNLYDVIIFYNMIYIYIYLERQIKIYQSNK